MRLKRSDRKKLGTAALGALIGSLLGVIYPLFGDDLYLGKIINGILIGAVIGGSAALVELFMFQERFRQLRFSLVLMARTAFYVALIGATIILEFGIYQSIKHRIPLIDGFRHPDFLDTFRSGEFLSIMLFSLVGFLVINFMRQVNRLLGQRVLLNYITGRYHRPVEEERIFMFLDINSSTTLAERLGHIRYHTLLNDFFYDITEPIVESGGEIYQYVGDEVVVTWRRSRGVERARCLACFFDIRRKIEQKREEYIERFGVVPAFKAGLHFGTVVTAEVGDIKKEIVFHGDVVNTASRIQAECRLRHRDVLVSEDLLAILPELPGLAVERIGPIRLRGKERDVEIYGVGEKGGDEVEAVGVESATLRR